MLLICLPKNGKQIATGVSGSTLVYPTLSEFSTFCGCSSTSSDDTPVIEDTPTPSPVSSTATCTEGDSFRISSPAIPEVEGCYYDSGHIVNGVVLYTVTGTPDYGQLIMVGAIPDSTEPDNVS